MRRLLVTLGVAALAAGGSVAGWELASNGTPPVSASIRALPPRSERACLDYLTSLMRVGPQQAKRIHQYLAFQCRGSSTSAWYELTLHSRTSRPVLAECQATFVDARGRAFRPPDGTDTWGLVVNPASGNPGSLAVEVDPGHDLQVVYFPSVGGPEGVAGYRSPSCHTVPTPPL